MLYKVKAWRRYKSWTQVELAARAGVSWLTVLRAEKGLRVRARTIRALAAAFGVEPHELRVGPRGKR